MINGRYSANEVAMLIGTTTSTISAWYKWKSLNPDHEYAKLLPDFTRGTGRNTRLWTEEDVLKLAEFKRTIPQGRHGIMGEVTQRYAKKNNKP